MAKYYVFHHVLKDFILDGNYSVGSFQLTPSDKVLLLNKEFRNKFDFEKYTDIVSRTQDFSYIYNSLSGGVTKKNFDYQKIRNFAIDETKNKIKNSVSYDTLLVQAINSIDEINKTSNLLSKRLREWFSHFLPEISDKISNHENYVKLLRTLSKEELLKKFSIEGTMGADFSSEDYSKVVSLADSLNNLYSLKQNYSDYVSEIIKRLCPNTAHYLGDMICARLISLSGSFEKLVNYPASTIQMLGAEKAFFRFLRNKNSKNPKYGVIYQHEYMSKVKAKSRGKLARILSNYASLALKIDYNSKEYDENKVKIISKSLNKFLEEKSVVK